MNQHGTEPPGPGMGLVEKITVQPPEGQSDAAGGRSNRLREVFFRRRLEIGLLSVVPAAFLVRPGGMFGSHETAGLAVSTGLIIAGMLLRIWAGGCAGTHTGDSRILAPRLATGGPYSHVRNPIYLGTILLGLGMVGVIGDIRLLPICLITFTLLYVMIIPAEERFLRHCFGLKYEIYCGGVPRILPRLTRWQEGRAENFSWGVLWGEMRIAAVLVFVYGVMGLAVHFK